MPTFKTGDQVIITKKAGQSLLQPFRGYSEKGRVGELRVITVRARGGDEVSYLLIFHSLRKGGQQHDFYVNPKDIELAEVFIANKSEELSNFANELGLGHLKPHKARSMYVQYRQSEYGDQDLFGWVANCLTMEGFDQDGVKNVASWFEKN